MIPDDLLIITSANENCIYFIMMKHFLFRKQVLNWEYLLSIPSLLVRLPVTVADDILKVYRAREVILGFFLEVSLNSP